MNGKSWSIPFGMVFKKYYCSKCGEKLVKEKTHRVVTKDDLDYYQYHEKDMYPRSPVDVYSYRFRCNNCRKAITYNEQCILEIIQKKYKAKYFFLYNLNLCLNISLFHNLRMNYHLLSFHLY